MLHILNCWGLQKTKRTKLEVLPYIVRLQNVPSFSDVNSFCWFLVWSWPYALNITWSKLPLKCSREISCQSHFILGFSHISGDNWSAYMGHYKGLPENRLNLPITIVLSIIRNKWVAVYGHFEFICFGFFRRHKYKWKSSKRKRMKMPSTFA